MKYEIETRNRYRSASEAESYKDGYTKGFSLRVMKNRLIAYFEQKAIMKATALCNGVEKIMDIPCGTGKMTKLLSDKYKTYLGADMSYEMIQEIESTKNLTFIQADGTAIPLLDNSLDAIVSLRLIHRLPAEVKFKFFNELSRISSEYLIFSFSDDSLSHRVLLRIKMILGIVPEKVVMESFKPYNELLMNNGFILKKKINVLPLISNQVIYLYAVK